MVDEVPGIGTTIAGRMRRHEDNITRVSFRNISS